MSLCKEVSEVCWEVKKGEVKDCLYRRWGLPTETDTGVWVRGARMSCLPKSVEIGGAESKVVGLRTRA